MQVDRDTVFEILQGTKGNVTEATKILNDSGIEISAKQLKSFILADPALSYVYQDGAINDIKFPICNVLCYFFEITMFFHVFSYTD